MRFPTKPTTNAWNIDARALISMGADSIDTVTAKGILDELDILRIAVKYKIQEIYENSYITEADEQLIKAINVVDGISEEKK